MQVRVKAAKTPTLDARPHETLRKEKEEEGFYGEIASSPLMAGLYSARLARPDQVVATLRLARQVQGWMTFDDRRLIRYLGYSRESASDKLQGSLSTENEASAVLRFWPDAGLAGERKVDTKSNSGR